MGNMRDNRISVSFQEETKKQLEAVAAKRGWSLALVVREAVKEYLKHQED